MKDINSFVSEREDLISSAFDKGDTDYANKLLEELEGVLVGEGKVEWMAEIYERFGQFTSAIELWEKLGNQEKVDELSEKRRSGLDEVNQNFKEEKLLRRSSLLMGIFSFFCSLFLFTQNMTGFVVVESEPQMLNLWAMLFFILFLFFIFVYLKKRGEIVF